ncbi:MAG TPA: hypothetical protein PKA37_03170 [Planctomycetota bacterium]|nr:hypothetical protein [Planctomycetota bacterium]
MNERSAITWWQSLRGLAFWLGLATVLFLVFTYGFLPARKNRREQVRQLDSLRREVQTLERTNEQGHLINQGLDRMDEGVIRHYLHQEGYVEKGRGIVLLPETSASRR